MTIYATGSTGYESGPLVGQTLIDVVSELTSFAEVSDCQVVNPDSPDVDRTLLRKLTKNIHADLAKPDTSGVVIAGTGNGPIPGRSNLL